MTTRAMKEIDNIGGVDMYLLSMDNATVQDSNYVTKIRSLIASKLFHQGLLHEVIIKKLGYHKNPPPKVVEDDNTSQTLKKVK
jgi:hypothetical protein